MKQWLAVVAVLALWMLAGCGGQETVQAPPRSEEETAADEIKKKAAEQKKAGADQSALTDLTVGDPAEFPNGITTTVDRVRSVERPDVPEVTIGPTGREEKNRTKEAQIASQMEQNEQLVLLEIASSNTNSGEPMKKNDGSALFEFNPTQFSAQDSQGYTLSKILTQLPESMVSPDYPLSGWQGELRPGQERRGTMVFTAPADAEFLLLYSPMGVPGGGGFRAEWYLGPVSEMPVG